MTTKECVKCKRILGKESFSNRAWSRPPKGIRRCKECSLAHHLIHRGQPRNKFDPSIEMKTESDRKRKSKASPRRNGNINSVKETEASAEAKKQKKGQKPDENKTKALDPVEVKEKLKSRINDLPLADQKTFEIEWSSKPVSERDEREVADKIILAGDYGPLDELRMAAIEDHIKSSAVTLSQAIDLRSSYLQEKIILRHVGILKQSRKLYAQYRKGLSILDLSKKFDHSPMNLLRVILSEMKMSKRAIKKALRNPNTLEERERNEFFDAESADVVSSVNQKELQKCAEEFEDVFSAWLEQKGIRFVRQKELENEQVNDFGKSILTPDFLLLDQVEINGSPCRWIDCKSYYGANLKLALKRTKQQMARYIDHWGSGAVVYLKGFSAAIEIDHCIILNAKEVLDRNTVSRLEKDHIQLLNNVPKTISSKKSGI